MRTLLLFLLLSPAQSPDPAALIAAGDRSYSALDARSALARYEEAIALDSTSYEAFWKASRSAVDLEPETRSDRARQTAVIRKAQTYARRAVGLNPGDAEGHFSLARALGVGARAVGTRERIRFGNEVRERALTCLQLQPQHSGCLHIMGAWNIEVMRLSGVERFIAGRILGARALGTASWAEAVRYMEAAVAAAPWRIAHRNELAELYEELGRTREAVREYRTALELPVAEFNDERYKARARSELARISSER